MKENKKIIIKIKIKEKTNKTQIDRAMECFEREFSFLAKCFIATILSSNKSAPIERARENIEVLGIPFSDELAKSKGQRSYYGYFWGPKTRPDYEDEYEDDDDDF